MSEEIMPDNEPQNDTPIVNADDKATEDLSKLSSEELQARIDAALRDEDSRNQSPTAATNPSSQPNPEFEQHMSELWEKKRAEREALDLKRQTYEAELLARQARHREELERRRLEVEQQLQASLAQKRAEKEAKATEMMETLREERERKQREREIMDAKLREERESQQNEWKYHRRLSQSDAPDTTNSEDTDE